ncbi:MAG TPA: dethiobiotin synthase [Candidatus Binataceae bacterium]|nr:dethiobiotin synthase [Candidatus Binataceae bacterium]
MGRRFLITGTDTAVGKTTVGCALAYALRARGMRVGVMKPAETDCKEAEGTLEPADARALAAAASCAMPIDLICPYRYRSPLAPAAAAEIDRIAPPDLGEIKRCFDKIASESDTVLVEGAGGLTVPITWDTDYADLALRLNLELIVVIGNRLGCLNAAVLTLKYAAARGLNVAGYILCDVEPAESIASQTNEDSLRRLTSVRYLGRMRHREPLSKQIVEQLL